MPGTSALQSGSDGQITTLSLRGLSSQNTLILLDNIPLNDGVSGAFNLAHFLSASTHLLSLLPGPQTLLYGDGAGGGALLLETPCDRCGNEVSVEAGSFETFNLAGSHSHATPSTRSAFHLQGYRTSGLSQREAARMKGEKAPYRNGTMAAAWERPSGPQRIKVTARIIEAEGRFDPEAGSLPKNPQNRESFRLAVAGAQILGQGCTSSHKLNAYVNHVHVKNTHDLLSTSSFLGAHYEGDLFWSEASTSEVIVDMKHSWFQRENLSKKSLFSSGLAALQKGRIAPEWSAEAGARVDHSFRGEGPATYIPSYRLGSTYAKETLLYKINYRTGFRNPSFYDLYVNNLYVLPNTRLRPERMETFEIGLQRPSSSGTSFFEVTCFHSTIKSLIHGVQVGSKRQASNLGSSVSSWGLESLLNWNFSPGWTASPAYSYTHFPSGGTGRVQEYPSHKGSVLVGYASARGWTCSAQVLYVGKRYSMGHRLQPYVLLGTQADYELAKNLRIFGRIDNLLDRRFSQVYGYRGKGRAFYVGTRFRF